MKAISEQQIKILSVLIDEPVGKILFTEKQCSFNFADGKNIISDFTHSPVLVLLAALANDNFRGIRTGLQPLLQHIEANRVVAISFESFNRTSVKVKVETSDGDDQFILNRNLELISAPYNKDEFKKISGTKITKQPPGRALSPLASTAFRRRARSILEKLFEGDKKGLLELPPMMVVMGLTDFCNHRCPFCFREKDPLYERTNGDVFTDENLTKLFLNLSEGNVQAIRLCGEGEDTVHPQYLKFILLTRVAGINLMQITNGSTLEKLAPIMVRCIDFLRISINGWNETDYRIKHGLNSSDTFFKVVDGLKSVGREIGSIRNRDITVCLSTVLTTEDCLQYKPEDFRRLFSDTKADAAILKLENECSRKIGDGSLRLKIHADKLLEKPIESFKRFQISPAVVDDADRQTAFNNLLNACRTIVPEAFSCQTGNVAPSKDWITELNLGCILRYIRVELERMQLYNCSVLHDFYGDLRDTSVDNAWLSTGRTNGIIKDTERPQVICSNCGWGDIFSVMNYFFDEEIAQNPRYATLAQRKSIWKA